MAASSSNAYPSLHTHAPESSGSAIKSLQMVQRSGASGHDAQSLSMHVHASTPPEPGVGTYPSLHVVHCPYPSHVAQLSPQRGCGLTSTKNGKVLEGSMLSEPVSSVTGLCKSSLTWFLPCGSTAPSRAETFDASDSNKATKSSETLASVTRCHRRQDRSV